MVRRSVHRSLYSATSSAQVAFTMKRPHIPYSPVVSSSYAFTLTTQDVAACTFVLYMFTSGMTRGEVLRYAIAYALRRSRKVIRGLKEGLTEDERFAVADHAVAQLKERGDPWRLNE
jgi:hypothetical protein